MAHYFGNKSFVIEVRLGSKLVSENIKTFKTKLRLRNHRNCFLFNLMITDAWNITLLTFIVNFNALNLLIKIPSDIVLITCLLINSTSGISKKTME